MERGFSWRWDVSWMVSLLVLSLSTMVAAQTIRPSSIAGTLTDESGAVLPGATITVTSPALQVPQLTTVSGARGEYQILNLPPGTFKVTYELTGFATLVREGIAITAGFTARLDLAMKLASQSETVTVTGESPTVDTTTTRGGATVSKELISSLPSAHNYQDVLLMVPGAQFNGPPMNGETGFRGHIGNFKSYGLTGQDSLQVEGIETIHNDTPDFLSAEEVDAKTYGNSAEVSFPGPNVQFIVKSGGNQFHGRGLFQGVGEKMQASNIDDNLRKQGVLFGDAPLFYWKTSGDLGGRIIPDKLWFYGGANYLKNKRTAPAYSRDAGPDGIYGNADDTSGEIPGFGRNADIKISYQATHQYRFIGFYAMDDNPEPELYASRLHPFESTAKFLEACRQEKIEWQGALSDQIVTNLMFGRGYYVVTYDIQDIAKNKPSRLNLETGLATGANFESLETLTRTPSRLQLNGNISYFPKRTFGGTHQFRAGYNLWWGSNRAVQDNNEPGNYQLVVDRINGVSNTPVELRARNYPSDGFAKYNTFAAHITDNWSPVKQVTLNLGVRWEYQHAFLPPQTKEQGAFGGAGTFPALDVGTWKTVVPRAGVAWDVTGNGKTVVKSTYGMYYFQLAGNGQQGFAHTYNPNSIGLITYRWHDLNGDRLYQPGEVDLNLNGPDFLSVSAATNNIINPDLKIPVEQEFTASLERDLGGNLSVRGLYVYKALQNQASNLNILRPYSAWSGFSRRDAGADAILGNADDGPRVTVYDFAPAYAGARFVGNQLINADRTDTFNNYEVSMNRRKSGKWFALTALVLTKNHRWLAGSLVPNSPNDDIFPLDRTWEYSYRLAGGYDLPRGILLSGTFQLYSGFGLQRTQLYRAVDPDGGLRLPSSSSVTLRAEEFGAEKGPVREIANVRLSKEVKYGGSSVEFQADVTNVFNTNVPWGAPTSGDGSGVIEASGPNFGYVTRIAQPRALRLGVSFVF